MADPKTKLEQLIEEHGGKLIRQANHNVFLFPNGKKLVVAKTPSCHRSYDNTAALLKNLLGVHSPDRGASGERREKRLKRRIEGRAILPAALHEVPTVDWKNKLAEVKEVLPEANRPVAQQRSMSSARIIKHPVHGQPKPESTLPPVDITDLAAKFKGDN
jgi:hypothetical protein